MRTTHRALVLVALLATMALAGCGGTQAAGPSAPTVNTNAPIGGSEGSNMNQNTMGGSGAAGTSSALTPAQLGQQIFTTGRGADGSLIAVSSGAGGPCARCHGSDGRGAVGPDIRWSVLTGSASSAHAPRFALANETDFGTALTTGAAGGNQLRGMMPHFQLTAEQISALVAYLKTL